MARRGEERVEEQVERPPGRAAMLEWLLQENAGGLERARSELKALAAEAARLREQVSSIEAERLTLERDLARSRALADRGLAAAGLAHDFNNLLQTVVGHATIALGDLPPGNPEHEALLRVVDAARRAADLSHGLARWERDERPPERPTDVNRAVGSVLDLLAVSAPPHVGERRVLLPDLPAARVDPTDLRRVVLNLVVNAWQAIGPRPGTLRVSTGTTAARGERMVYVEVEDDGPGLTDEARERVFEPFYTTREGGSGIGLPNVRLLVERWGGRIEVWSVPGQGARFRASLPVAPDETGADEA